MTRAHRIALIVHSLLLAGMPVLAQPYVITTVAGGAPPASGIQATQASIGDPPRVSVDASGNVYFGALHCVFRVNSSGVLIRIAGTARSGYTGDGGSALNAQLESPDGIAVDSAGNVYIADQGTNSVRKVAADGTISTYAGTGTAGFSGDGGPAIGAQLNQPGGLAVDGPGNLYIADTANNRIRVVSPDGHIATVAGNGAAGYSGDASGARDAALNGPEDITVDSSGSLYIADTQNYRIRVVTPNGIINTLAGVGNGNVFGDNAPAISAGLILPTAVALDRSGNLYIADFGNSRIRVVAVTGMISTVAGNGDGAPLTGSQGALSARLSGPTG
ncbi:MAG: hypothetical protein JO323_14055, partial [Acidobacteriia bacterium]|nr:hypothetical protein [Terriglobia bacterium]